MFRQPKTIDHLCSLFAGNTNISPLLVRTHAEPSIDSRKNHQSKKSLKYHSNSKSKDLKRISFTKLNIAQITKNPTLPSSDIDTARSHQESESINHTVHYQYGTLANGSTGELHHDGNKRDHKNPSNNLKQKHKKAFQMTESNQAIHNRDVSPLCPQDANVQLNKKKQIVFNYQANQYQLRLAPSKRLQNDGGKTTNVKYQNSATTTLSGSAFVPNSTISKIIDLKMIETQQLQRNKHTSPPGLFLIQSPENASHLIRPPKIQLNKLHRLHSLKKNQIPEPAGRQLFTRLDDIVNQKQQIESIYADSEKSLDTNGNEYSRVLVSYKKMIENKNEFLELGVQSKLFGFGEGERNNLLANTRKEKRTLQQQFDASAFRF